MKRRLQLIKSRHSAGLSTGALAKKIGVSKSTIIFIENCRCNPSWEVAKALSNYFNEDPRTLLAESEEAD